MEVTKRKLNLKMNMFVKRQNQGQMSSSCGGGDASSSPPCSCPCWEMTQQLNEKVRSLVMQMEKYGRIIREFEDIRGELLWEARGSPVDDDGDYGTIAIKKEEPDYDLEGLNDNLSVTEVEDVNDRDNEASHYGNDQYENSMDCVIVESVSLATTSDWPSSGGSNPGSSGSSRTFGELGIMAPAGDHVHNDSVNSNWGSFGEHLAISENSMNSTPEQGDQQVEQARTKRKRRKKGGGNAGTPTSSLPDDSLICPHCATGHVFKEKASLRRHIQHFHAEERKTYDCLECNRTFQYKEGLAYHVRSVHEGIRHLCGVGGCTSAYSTITALRKHQRVAGHTGDGLKIRINDPGTYAMYKPEWDDTN